MNPDLTALYKKQYETLTDRLAKMDQARAGATPEALSRVSLAGRVEGEDPMTRINAGMDIGNINNTSQMNSMKLQMEALDKLSEQLKSNQPDSLSQKDLLDLKMTASDKGLELYQKEDGSFDVRPVSGGDTNFDVKAGAKLVKDGFKKLSDFPKAQQPQIEAELTKITAEEGGVIKKKALGLVDELLNMDTSAITGSKNPLKYLSGEAYEVESKVRQLISNLSLDSRKLLKGSGTITDAEMDMLENSVTSLSGEKGGVNSKLNNAAFKRELLNLKKALSGQEVNTNSKKAEIDALFDQTMTVSGSAQLK